MAFRIPCRHIGADRGVGVKPVLDVAGPVAEVVTDFDVRRSNALQPPGVETLHRDADRFGEFLRGDQPVRVRAVGEASDSGCSLVLMGCHTYTRRVDVVAGALLTS